MAKPLIHSSSRLVAFSFLLMSVFFWGISFISTKIVLEEVPPSSIAFFRQFIACAVLFTALLLRGRLPRMPIRDFLLLSLSSLFGIVLYFVFENSGLMHTTASNASMIVAAVPIFTLLAEALVFHMHISHRAVICIAISILGVYLVISVNGRLEFASSTFLGNILVMGAMVCWVIYTLLSRNLQARYDSITLVAYQSLSSIFLFMPFVIPEIPQWHGISTIPLLNLLYLGIFCSAFSYYFYLYATQKLGATLSSAFLNLTPVISVAAGYIVLDEKLALPQFGGLALILGSLFLLSRQQSPSKGTVQAPDAVD